MLKIECLKLPPHVNSASCSRRLVFHLSGRHKKKGMERFNEDSLQKERHIYIYFFLVVAITIIHPQKETESIQDCTLCI